MRRLKSGAGDLRIQDEDGDDDGKDMGRGDSQSRSASLFQAHRLAEMQLRAKRLSAYLDHPYTPDPEDDDGSANTCEQTRSSASNCNTPAWKLDCLLRTVDMLTRVYVLDPRGTTTIGKGSKKRKRVDGNGGGEEGKGHGAGDVEVLRSPDELGSIVLHALVKCLGLRRVIAALARCVDSGVSAVAEDLTKRLYESAQAAIRNSFNANSQLNLSSTVGGVFADRSVSLRSILGESNVAPPLEAPGNQELAVKVEVGAGDGEWVVSRAAADRGTAKWLAIEQRHDRAHAIATHAVLQHVSNVAVLVGDAAGRII